MSIIYDLEKELKFLIYKGIENKSIILGLLSGRKQQAWPSICFRRRRTDSNGLILTPSSLTKGMWSQALGLHQRNIIS